MAKNEEQPKISCHIQYAKGAAYIEAGTVNAGAPTAPEIAPKLLICESCTKTKAKCKDGGIRQKLEAAEVWVGWG